ncbi:hypothetical protein HPY31_18760 [Brevibacillus sp. HB1.3]|uniref:Imm3 family immunity protein n=1 Tax=Brevibacillus sp. HB1.3 TaxID=2738842 RepID=UPI001553BDFE|nr:Imm3 family immunity protein [Brevibacillus sp. HB1.3]NQF15940.1 hypothetical protein [Brevibacillus sp. HB1.3]
MEQSLEWEYQELFDEINKDYLAYRARNMSLSECLARTWDVYENVENMGEMEKIVVNVAFGELSLLPAKIFVNLKKHTVEALNQLNMFELQQVLTTEQLTDLMRRRDHVLQNIEHKPVDAHPLVRWYYSEMKDEVIKFLNVFTQETSHDGDIIIFAAQERFQRDCKNTRGENMNVQTTIAEFLISKNITNYERFHLLKSEIQQFQPDQLNEQLSLDEKAELTLRIKKVRNMYEK